MSVRPLTGFGIRIRVVVFTAMVGFVLGGYLGVRWELRNGSVQIQRIFLRDYVPERIEQALGIAQLPGFFQPSIQASGWLQQFPVSTQMSYWRERFAGCMDPVEAFAISGASFFAVIALWLTRRHRIDLDGDDVHLIHRRVPRPWD
jgi:hypothetical protein